MGCVYVAICSMNGKKYVGKTSGTLAKRRKRHERDALSGSAFPFHRALSKYRFDSFTWITCFTGQDEAALYQAEARYIEKLGSKLPSGYNVTDGGKGFIGVPMTDEHKARIGNANKGRIRSEETRKRISQARIGITPWNKGRSMSDVTKQKLREAATGRMHSDETKKKLSNLFRGRRSPNLGKVTSDETKFLLSRSLKGRKKSGSTRERMRLAWVKRKLEG